MKKLLLIALLIVCAFAEEQEMDALEKQMVYKQNDRSPLFAGLCAIAPTMGHLYVGEWNKRLIPNKYTLLAGATLFPIGYAWTDEYSFWTTPDYRDADYDGCPNASSKKCSDAYNTRFLITYLSVLLPHYLLTIQDAIYLAYQHNADLYEEIYGKEYIRPPKKSLIQKIIDKKEAKKTP